jgi:peptidoglycan hydrolase-like protein with peptidoglycan-binding domain/biotin carboxyl carrier protein
VTAVEDAHTAPPAADAEPQADEATRRRRWLVWAALGIVVIAVGAGAWLWAGNSSTEAAPAGTGPVKTATVKRGTISATESWDGTLEYALPITVKSSAGGTITRLVDQGETIARGEELYRVNERPVTLLYGAVPMYRDLAPGDSGVDVRQLETNLAELGYDGFAVDGAYTASTADAVRAWQTEIGAEQTGTVARRDVVFVAAGGRVEALNVGVGDVVRPGAPVLDITGTEKVVNLQADLDDQDRLRIDAKVTVVLAGGDEIAGMVSATRIVKVAAAQSGEGLGGGATDSEPILQVEIALARAPDDLVGTPVDAVVAIDKRSGVLLAPISALLALSDGGYGLEVVRDDGTTKIVRVDTGLFADGKVEVRGAGIAEGTVVGVAGR